MINVLASRARADPAILCPATRSATGPIRRDEDETDLMSTTADADWHSAHIYYHDRAATDALLLGAVRPLLTELADAGLPTTYFVPHWLRGPHVRVHVRTDEETWRTVAVPLVEKVVGHYLRAHPSRARLDREREHIDAAERARLEGERGPLAPWYPDNSVQFPPYDRQLHVLGTQQAADLLADFHVRSTPLAFRIMAEEPAGASRWGALLSLMFASAHLGCPPIAKGYLTYRFQVEAHLAGSTDPGATRARFERMYQVNREPLAHQLTASINGVGEPYLADWAEIVAWVLDQARVFGAAGLLPMPTPAPGAGNIEQFHDALLRNESMRTTLGTARWFLAYRVLLHHQNMLFSRLGLGLDDRFVLCHLAARTVEDAHGIDPEAVLDHLRSGAPLWSPG